MSQPYEAQQALDKAKDCLDDAAYNLQGGRTIVCVNRCYYSFYYCMCCLLYIEDITAKTHKGVQQKFNEVFVKTNRFPVYTAKWISDAFNLRQFGDYDFEAIIPENDAQQLLQQGLSFHQMTHRYFEDFIRR